MADVLPQSFPLPSESAIASYSYTDIAEGTGVQIFYPVVLHTDAGVGYLFTPNVFYSDSDYIELTATDATPTTAYELEIDKDFDISFNAPKTLRGTAYVNGSIACYNNGTGTTTSTYATLTLIRYDGSEHTIGSSSCYPLSTANNATTKKLFSIPIGITETLIKIGETLRLTVQVYAKKNAAGGGGGDFTVAIGSDPMDRDGTYIIPSTDDPVTTTQLKCFIPFKLDL